MMLLVGIRLIWKFFAQDCCGFDVKVFLVAGKLIKEFV